MTKKSPVKVVCKADVFGRPKRICRWVCGPSAAGAHFRDRHDSSAYAVVHRSTKPGRAWQASFFDARGAASDITGPSCSDVAKELHPSRWRLVEAATTLAGTRRKPKQLKRRR